MTRVLAAQSMATQWKVRTMTGPRLRLLLRTEAMERCAVLEKRFSFRCLRGLCPKAISAAIATSLRAVFVVPGSTLEVWGRGALPAAVTVVVVGEVVLFLRRLRVGGASLVGWMSENCLCAACAMGGSPSFFPTAVVLVGAANPLCLPQPGWCLVSPTFSWITVRGKVNRVGIVE